MWNEGYFGAAARRASRADYQAWLLEQTDRISKTAESGDLRPFWSLVCALEGKRKRLVPRPMMDQAGNPATDPSRIAELMAELFCTEFGHRVKTDECDDVDPLPMFRGDQSDFEVPTMEPLCGQLKMMKATGPDCIPNEILRGAGQNFLSTFADLVVRVLQEGAPASWRGGMMTPVPKQAKKPMGQDNALWESSPPSTSGATPRDMFSLQCYRAGRLPQQDHRVRKSFGLRACCRLPTEGGLIGSHFSRHDGGFLPCPPGACPGPPA